MSLAICSICRTYEPDVTMVVVPRNETKRQLWSKVCGISLQRSSLICDRHFAEKDFIGSSGGSAQRGRLKPGAIPSLFDIKNEFEEFLIEHDGKESNIDEALEDTKSDNKQENDEFINEELFDDNSSIGVNTRMQYITVGVQTCAKRTRTCGSIEVTADNQMYSLNCFYCDEVFALWDWTFFIKHLREQHNPKSIDAGRRTETTVQNIQRSGSDNESELEQQIEDEKYEDASNASIFQEIEEDEFRQLSGDDNDDITGSGAENQSESQDKETDENEVSCDLCSDTFPDEAVLQIHQILRHKPHELLYNCKHCDQRFANLNKYEQHVREHSSMERYFCQRCSKGFPDEATLSDHKAIHKICDVCDKELPTPSKYRLHMLLHEPPKYKCTICSKLYHKPRLLLEHLKAHRGQRDYVCEECGKAFVRQTNLMQHKLSVHSGQKLCECKICGFTFKSFGNLHHHRRRAHLVLEGTIEELANPAKRYRKHQSVVDPNTNQRRIVCNLCGNTYRYHGGLRVHMMKAHGDQSSPKRRKMHATPIIAKQPDELPAAEEQVTVQMGEGYVEIDVDGNDANDIIEQLYEDDLEITEVEILDEDIEFEGDQTEIEVIEYVS